MGEGILTAAEFTRVAGALWCEGVPLDRIVEETGTPVYVYSAASIRARYSRLDKVLAPVPHRIHYTLKGNSNHAILQLVRELGAGADVVSGGELYRALRAGFHGGEIIFGGVGKTERELREALEAGVLFINAESVGEVQLLESLGKREGRGASIAVSLRVNPEITLETPHQYIKTGERGQKFGIPYDDVLHVARVVADAPHLRIVGLDMHLGSQLSRIDPYRSGVDRLLAVHDDLRAAGISSIEYLDIGGGLGVRYDTEQPPDLERFAELVLPPVAGAGLTLIMEPGRFVVGNAGALVTRVLYRKHSGGREYVIADAGMTELLRPSHYGAFHRIEAVQEHSFRTLADVVGPVCESGDFLALDREVDDVLPGELLAVRDVGAYGYAMASNYNSRTRAPEVLVDGSRFAVVTCRERYEDLVRLEIVDPDWRT